MSALMAMALLMGAAHGAEATVYLGTVRFQQKDVSTWDEKWEHILPKKLHVDDSCYLALRRPHPGDLSPFDYLVVCPSGMAWVPSYALADAMTQPNPAHFDPGAQRDWTQKPPNADAPLLAIPRGPQTPLYVVPMEKDSRRWPKLQEGPPCPVQLLAEWQDSAGKSWRHVRLHGFPGACDEASFKVLPTGWWRVDDTESNGTAAPSNGAAASDKMPDDAPRATDFERAVGGLLTAYDKVAARYARGAPPDTPTPPTAIQARLPAADGTEHAPATIRISGPAVAAHPVPAARLGEALACAWFATMAPRVSPVAVEVTTAAGARRSWTLWTREDFPLLAAEDGLDTCTGGGQP